jgi:L-threonylcarbamoyladenylate synthase
MVAGQEGIADAVVRLRTGGVVAFPTETVYGLGADALNPRAVARIFELKGRPANNPLIVHVATAAISRCVVAPGAWSHAAQRLSEAFWPGPLSIVLPKDMGVPEAVTAGGPNVAVRCPDHPMALSLLEAFGGPLVGPSANISGRVSPTTAEHVRSAFNEQDVLVLDGGPCRAGIESTVVSLVGEPRVLRPGLVSAAEIARVIQRPVSEPEYSAVPEPGGAPLESPGQLASHYAPAARTIIAESQSVLGDARTAGGSSVIISWSGLEWPRIIRMPRDATGYAAHLYAALREADAVHPSLIVVERPPMDGDQKSRAIWMAVMDRLGRAAAQ